MPATLLVVDDDDDFRGALVGVLREEGYFVREAADGVGAMYEIGLVRPDLILLDLMMPNGNGWGVLELLRGKAEIATIPVVVVSAYGSSVPSGARSLLQKPVRRADLLATVDAHLVSD